MRDVHSIAGQPASRTAPWRYWVKTSRPITLTATVSPVFVGTAVAAFQGTFHLWIFLVTFVACMSLQIASNYINEYFDYRYGLDHEGSLGASTVIFRGEMTANQVLGGGIFCILFASLLGIILIFSVGPEIILFGVAAILIAYFYSAKPFKFSSRGLGDVMVFLAMGLIMTWGSYYVQIHQWSWNAIIAEIPVGLTEVSILNMNNTRDYEDDLAVNKGTLPVRFGMRFAKRYHAVLLTAAYVVVTLGVLIGLLPWSALLVWLVFPLAFSIMRTVLQATERKVYQLMMKKNSQHHLFFGLAFTLGLVLAILLHIP
jgi:1,4-dihydroxy-2-naphthoate octaprenyltransferase